MTRTCDYDQLRAEVERLTKLEVWFTEAIDALHVDVDEARAEVTTLEWQLSEATKEVERLLSQREEAVHQWAADLADKDAEIERLRAVNGEAVARLTVIVDAFDGECRLDHHGFCQEHLVTKPCEILEARHFLASCQP